MNKTFTLALTLSGFLAATPLLAANPDPSEIVKSDLGASVKEKAAEIGAQNPGIKTDSALNTLTPDKAQPTDPSSVIDKAKQKADEKVKEKAKEEIDNLKDKAGLNKAKETIESPADKVANPEGKNPKDLIKGIKEKTAQ